MVEIKSKDTEHQEGGYERKLQPKVKIQKYDYPKEEILIGSKKEKLRINKIKRVVSKTE